MTNRQIVRDRYTWRRSISDLFSSKPTIMTDWPHRRTRSDATSFHSTFRIKASEWLFTVSNALYVCERRLWLNQNNKTTQNDKQCERRHLFCDSVISTQYNKCLQNHRFMMVYLFFFSLALFRGVFGLPALLYRIRLLHG